MITYLITGFIQTTLTDRAPEGLIHTFTRTAKGDEELAAWKASSEGFGRISLDELTPEQAVMPGIASYMVEAIDDPKFYDHWDRPADCPDLSEAYAGKA